MSPPDLAARVLLRDANLLFLDKPAGLAVHGGPKTPESLDDHLGALRFGLRHDPVPGHRLDRDTSGVLVLARHPKAASRLGRLFGAHLVEKTYWAVVEGVPSEDEGVVDLALEKHNTRAGWTIRPAKEGQRAVTRWRVAGRGQGVAFLELHPETGRTHQIRVHLAEMGWPILGDAVYGRGNDGQALHLLARRIAIPYWQERPPVVAEAPVPGILAAGFEQGGFAQGGWTRESA